MVERTPLTGTSFLHNKAHLIIICPCPPTKTLGVIKPNCCGNYTAAPWATSWSSGVVRFGREKERVASFYGVHILGEIRHVG